MGLQQTKLSLSQNLSLVLTASLALALVLNSICWSAETMPNVVLIMADDLGWKDLHCYGNEKLDTPNFDRLAKQGLLFTNAYSASPVCTRF